MAVALAMRTWRQRAGDSAARLRQAEAEHEAETRRAVEAERACIASELHDVVTHNVSVMVVQAGAARRVLGSSSEQAPEAQIAIEALLAVEASGRTAMGELRHLLGLLAPSGGDNAALVPQPDVGQVRSLVERVRLAGLPVELTITEARALPPGVALAAYRVVQEGLTNVIKQADQARVVGFLLKDVSPEHLIAAVRHGTLRRRAARPVHHPPPGRAVRPARGFRDGVRDGDLSALTPRELEVLGLVARGLSNAELAAALTLSEATVKTHVARILAKLQLRDRVQAVVLAYETGLVSPR